MELSRTQIILSALLCLICTAHPASAALLDSYPNDQPTIEALIDAHKKMKSAEDLAVLQLTSIYETHDLSTQETDYCSQAITWMNRRMSDVNSYLILATHISNVSLKIYRLGKAYVDFTEYGAGAIKEKPYLAVYYLRANYALKEEVSRLTRLITAYVAGGVNLLKATMEEKYMFLTKIETCINRMNGVIWRNELMCRSVMNTGLKIYHIQEILNEQTDRAIAAKLIALWDKNQGS